MLTFEFMQFNNRMNNFELASKHAKSKHRSSVALLFALSTMAINIFMMELAACIVCNLLNDFVAPLAAASDYWQGFYIIIYTLVLCLYNVCILFSFCFPDDIMKYWTYSGSLTWPPCYETVTWILFEKPVYVTSKTV